MKTFCLILTLGLAFLAVHLDVAEAKLRRGSVTLEEGTNRRGNDIARIEYRGRRRFLQNQSQHFSMEEYLYGPGDQSRIWHRPRGERLEPRSGRYSSGDDCPYCPKHGGSW